MIWILLGLLSAWFFSLYHIAAKRFVKDTDPVYLAYCRLLMFALITLPLLFVFSNTFIFNWQFFVGMTLIGSIVTFTARLYMSSLKLASISKTIPLLSVSPLVTLPLAFFVEKQFPSWRGILGVAIIIFGAYILNLEKFNKRQLLLPFRSIISDKGSRFMLIVAFLYGILGAIDKWLIVHTNIITRLLWATYFTVFIFSIYLWIKDKQSFSKIKDTFQLKYKALILLVILIAASLFLQFWAMALSFAAYIIALKRVSAFFSVVIAFFIFREKKYFSHHLLGTIFLVLGVILLSL
jgi:drug/metabolite transporter (DMT)-like permease